MSTRRDGITQVSDGRVSARCRRRTSPILSRAYQQAVFGIFYSLLVLSDAEKALRVPPKFQSASSTRGIPDTRAVFHVLPLLLSNVR
jgi:hypothetical protein